MNQQKRKSNMRAIGIIIVAVGLVAAGLWYNSFTTSQMKKGFDGSDAPPVDTREVFVFPEDFEGVEVEDQPEFDVACEVRYENEKAFITFTVTERHGWAVEEITVEYWHVKTDENGVEKQIGDPAVFFVRGGYLDFDSTLTDFTTLYYLEFEELDEEFGTSDNWRARVKSHGDIMKPAA